MLWTKEADLNTLRPEEGTSNQSTTEGEKQEAVGVSVDALKALSKYGVVITPENESHLAAMSVFKKLRE